MKHKTILSALDAHYKDQPDKLALVFLSNDLSPSSSLTYKELVESAKRVGSGLVSEFAEGSGLILPAPNTREFILAFFGCLYGGMAPIPISPNNKKLLRDKIEDIAREGHASGYIVLEPNAAHPSPPENLRQVDIFDLLEFDGPKETPNVTEDAIAYIQYTSGTGAASKGAVISHRNVVSNMEMIRSSFEHTDNTPFVSWLPFFHDMGLAGTLLQPLYCGTVSHLLSPQQFLRDPSIWLRAISKYSAYTSGAPNFAYDLCVAKIDPKELANVDLSSWRVAFNGAEPVRAQTVEAFTDTFASLGLNREAMFPCYGMAEATLFVSGGPVGAGMKCQTRDIGRDNDDPLNSATNKLPAERDATPEFTRKIVSCGKIANCISVAIVNENGSLLPDGCSGQVVISGPNVFERYLNSDDNKSSSIEIEILQEKKTYFKTGDIGFIHDGELFIEGRLKELIIASGRNIHPHDLEATLRGSINGTLTPKRVVCFQNEAGEIWVIAEFPRLTSEVAQDTYDELITTFCQVCGEEFGFSLSGVCLVRVGTIPVTTSGKVVRKKCAELVNSNSPRQIKTWLNPAVSKLQAASPKARGSNDIEHLAHLLQLVSEILEIELEDISWPLTRSGLDSIHATELQQKLHSSVGLQVSLHSIFAARSPEDLLSFAAELRQAARTQDSPVPPDKKRCYPMSRTQRSIWSAATTHEETLETTIVVSLTAKENVNANVLEAAVNSVLKRHPILCAVVAANDHGELSLHTGNHNCFWSYKTNRDPLQEANTYLSEKKWENNNSLFEVILFSRPGTHQQILVLCNHVIADLVSMAVILDDLSNLLLGNNLTPNPDLGLDHQLSRTKIINSAEKDRAEAFWRRALQPPPSQLVFPSNVRSDHKPGRTSQCHFAFSKDLSEALLKTSSDLCVTPFSVLCTAYSLLVRKYSNSQDFVLGTPVSTRVNEAAAASVGCFIDMAPIPIRLKAETPCSDHIQSVENFLLKARDYSWFNASPFAARSLATREARQKYAAIFAYQSVPRQFQSRFSSLVLGQPGRRFDLGSTPVETTPLNARPPLAALDMAICNTDEIFEGYIGSDGHFSERSLIEMSTVFSKIVGKITKNPQATLADTSARSLTQRPHVEEKYRLQTKEAFSKRIEVIFDEHAAKDPNSVAIRDNEGTVSYAKLRVTSLHIANKILSKLATEKEDA